MSKQKSFPLGRGLESILGNAANVDLKKTNQKVGAVTAEIANIPLKDIEPNPEQPRKDFDEESLNELAQSIKENGIITPITVNKQGEKYQIIAGERRYRASKIAGLSSIPAYIKVVTELQTMEMALIENIQRDDLNAIEIALSLKALIDETQLSPADLGKKIGKSRETVINYMRLLKLPAEVQIALRKDEISMGHARGIVSVDDEAKQIEIVRRIKEENLSVRQVETIVARLKEEEKKVDVQPKAKKSKAKKQLPEYHTEVRNKLSNAFSSNVEITRSQRGKGAISIPFSNDKDFERIVALLKML